jgi:hypothetical protein
LGGLSNAQRWWLYLVPGLRRLGTFGNASVNASTTWNKSVRLRLPVSLAPMLYAINHIIDLNDIDDALQAIHVTLQSLLSV